MDIEDVRSMIRASIRAQVSKLVEQRRHPPRTFTEFNSLLQEVVSPVDIDHDISYEMWENISSEMDGTDGVQRVNEWNDSLKYYVSRAGLEPHVKNAILKHLTRR